VTASRPAVGPT